MLLQIDRTVFNRKRNMDGANGSTASTGTLFPAPDSRGYSNLNFSNALPGNDVSHAIWRDDVPPSLYDNDAPGIWARGLNRAQNTIQRFRSNFRQYTFIRIGGTDVRCSDNLAFWFRMSYRQNGAGNTDQWQEINDVPNDNASGAGTTGMNWNSQN